MRKRAETLARVSTDSYDLCVIGGGATGAGCALDAQLRGLKTVLVDRGDFGSATSTASTKLIHGGLRYLELAVKELDVAQYRVVRTALRERSRMMRNAPYLTRSRLLAVPCHSLAQALYSRIGIMFYDWLSGTTLLAPSYFLNRRACLKEMPWLNPDRLFGAVIYSDGQFDDGRYNFALVQSFVAAGGDALNYAPVCGFEKNQNGAVVAAHAQDASSGTACKVHARAFVNATGPFSDQVRRYAVPKLSKRLRQSKGVHILLPLREDWGDRGLLIPATEDGRVIFSIPWMGRLLVGTTDSESDPGEEMIVTKAEAKFLLRHVNRYLVRPFDLSDIVTAIAGMRPLIQPADARDSKKIARDYEIEVEPQSGLISVLGGKWSLYRVMAEDAVNAVELRLRGTTSRCRTQNYALFGADREENDIKEDLLARYAVEPATIDHLVKKFGSRARDVLELADNEPQWLELLVEGAPYRCAEAVYCARQEMVTSLEDLLSRRLGIEQFDWRMALRAAAVAAGMLADELGWNGSRTQEEISLYTARIHRFLHEIGACAPGEERVDHGANEQSKEW